MRPCSIVLRSCARAPGKLQTTGDDDNTSRSPSALTQSASLFDASSVGPSKPSVRPVWFLCRVRMSRFVIWRCRSRSLPFRTVCVSNYAGRADRKRVCPCYVRRAHLRCTGLTTFAIIIDKERKRCGAACERHGQHRVQCTRARRRRCDGAAKRCVCNYTQVSSIILAQTRVRLIPKLRVDSVII